MSIYFDGITEESGPWGHMKPEQKLSGLHLLQHVGVGTINIDQTAEFESTCTLNINTGSIYLSQSAKDRLRIELDISNDITDQRITNLESQIIALQKIINPNLTPTLDLFIEQLFDHIIAKEELLMKLQDRVTRHKLRRLEQVSKETLGHEPDDTDNRSLVDTD